LGKRGGRKGRGEEKREIHNIFIDGAEEKKRERMNSRRKGRGGSQQPPRKKGKKFKRAVGKKASVRCSCEGKRIYEWRPNRKKKGGEGRSLLVDCGYGGTRDREAGKKA